MKLVKNHKKPTLITHTHLFTQEEMQKFAVEHKFILKNFVCFFYAILLLFYLFYFGDSLIDFNRSFEQLCKRMRNAVKNCKRRKKNLKEYFQ